MRAVFWLFRALAFIVNLLPYRLIYLKSDLMAPVVHHLIRYRKKIVNQNLENSFPEKSTSERHSIARQYYRNMMDIIFEIMKMEKMTQRMLDQKVETANQELLTALSKSGKGIVMVMSHSGNWEWACRKIALDNSSNFQQVRVFAKEMSSRNFDIYMNSIRLKGLPANVSTIPFAESSRQIASLRHTTSLLIAIADQTPHVNQIQYRTEFLHQDTPIFLGPERIARALGYALVFCHVKHNGRGKYSVDYELVTDNMASMPEHRPTDLHVQLLERDINANPADWLWSHRRWKY